LDIVEDVREKAIKACGTTFKDTKKFLESAKPKQEKGELASAFEDRMVKLLENFKQVLKDYTTLMEKRIKLSETALKLYKEKKELPKDLKKWAEGSAINDGIDAVPSLKGKDEVQSVIQWKKAVKGQLPIIVQRCESFVAEIKQTLELRAKAEQLQKELRKYIQSGMDRRAEKEGIF
jgi:hypothetical protein